MSFILDALKKSENDRQRQNGPALFEVRVAAPRSRFPLLAVVIVALLVVNLGVVAWIMLRKPAAAATPSASAAATPAPGITAASAAQPAINAPPNALPPAPAQGFPQVAQGAQPQPGMAPAAYNGAPPPSAAYNGYAQGGNPPPNYAGAAPSYPQSASNYGAPAPSGAYGAANAGPSFGRASNPDPNLTAQSSAPAPDPVNPDDYAPARDAPPPGLGAGRAVRGTESGLPTYEEAATRTSIPPLHMDLHSYAADPTKRFVLINMKRLYEGQSLPEGPKVERITTDSAIMSYNGQQFVLDKN